MRRIGVLLAACLAGAAAVPSVPAQGPAPFWQQKGCDHEHRSSVAYKRIAELLRNEQPVAATTKAKVGHYATCLATQAKAHAAHVRARAGWRWRHSYAHRWPIVFHRFPAWAQSWARSTSSCESHNQAHIATGNGFYGAFQFMPSTWAAAGGEGMPNEHSWDYQAVIAIRLMLREGAGHWPVCG